LAARNALPSWRMISPRLAPEHSAIPETPPSRGKWLVRIAWAYLTDCGKNFAVDRGNALENCGRQSHSPQKMPELTAFRPNFFSKAVVDTPGFGLERDFMLDDL